MGDFFYPVGKKTARYMPGLTVRDERNVLVLN